MPFVDNECMNPLDFDSESKKSVTEFNRQEPPTQNELVIKDQQLNFNKALPSAYQSAQNFN